ncbi:NAD(P)/FAD-dependent oxidoreductase [Paenibacillus spongiae]|uniref:NAD(P)/FAD-dependent oxidoreductase n=1 Tax=Paenibacillus spongiae TaxID=2909671 RepID=A0ABY5S1H6_9BACL|nr:NAD(P)/FAD-dependent oxidoreductase [Paenibacillus spongiae]UVI27712.1 NAD(P)/FAD-dependent oxidoreductase [Paenibacillus spongiae]
MLEADIAIVGSGPAGSMLSLLLAKLGIKVVMLEASVHPRRKPCGEALNPGAMQLLQRVGLGLMDGISCRSEPIHGWRLHYGKTILEAQYPNRTAGVACPRSLLDDWLVREAVKAGARIEEGARVKGLLYDNGKIGGVYGRTITGSEFSAASRFVVGADGLGSVVARAAGLNRFGKLRKAAFTVHVSGVEHLEPIIELHLQPDLVVGLAPVGEGLANMTIGTSGSRAGLASGRKSEFVREAIQQLPRLASRMGKISFEDDLIACGPFDRPNAPAAGSGVLLVGDAAGYYDPLTGQGIYRALRMAELAAPLLLEALCRNSELPLYAYDRLLKQEFARGTRLQRFIQYGTGHPLLFHSALRCISVNQGLRSKLAAVIGDC